MIYLDTHVVIWLSGGCLNKFNKSTLQLIENNQLTCSAMVSMELQLLYEIKRITLPAEELMAELSKTIGLTICDLPLSDIAFQANKLHWTRDPFDRLIVANAMVEAKPLITKDKTIHKHYKLADW